MSTLTSLLIWKRSNANCMAVCDEIHRFSKSQQDIFLAPVESGQITLCVGTSSLRTSTMTANTFPLELVQRLRIRPSKFNPPSSPAAAYLRFQNLMNRHSSPSSLVLWTSNALTTHPQTHQHLPFLLSSTPTSSATLPAFVTEMHALVLTSSNSHLGCVDTILRSHWTSSRNLSHAPSYTTRPGTTTTTTSRRSTNPCVAATPMERYSGLRAC